MKIDTKDKEIKEILESGFYIIPRFQRPYSWTAENVDDFWTDTIQGGESDYFIGPMVVYKSEGGLLGIVDGQQRLTTITMIICGLRNSMHEEGLQGLAEGIHTLVERKDIDNQFRFILATETSFPYFQEFIQKYGKPAIALEPGVEEKNLAAAYERLEGYIEASVQSVKDDPTLGDEDKKAKIEQKLKEIRDKILGLKLIFITLENDDDAYTIFETLNTRGKDLTVSDLAKNLFTRLLKPESVTVDTPKLKWQKIQETIESSSLELNTNSFLLHDWLSKYSFVTVKKLFKQMKGNVKKDNAQAFLDSLVEDSVTYREIHETSYRQWKPDEMRIKQSLDAFVLFRIQQHIPMILSVMRDYKAGRLKRKDVEMILSAIENFHFIFTAITSQRSSGGISQMYASSARKLDAAKTESEKKTILSDLHKKLREGLPRYDEFDVAFRALLFSRDFTKSKKVVKYILVRLDAHHNQAAAIDYEKMTIEHLAPQSLEVGGLEEAIVGQLGNLILVKENTNNKLANKDFPAKKKILKDSNIFLDHKIESATQWSAKEIEERTKWMAKIAYQTLWKV